ncbi:MAG: phosphatase PAP2 family protein [Pseudomonadota bacterium]|nr:phosphatase PAP2 family protein [Pseudomonadota bacterium]
MSKSVPATALAAARPVGDAIGYGLGFLREHGWRMLLWFVCLLLPLWGFSSLVGEVHKKAVFPFDAPLLNALHAWATPTLDRFFVLVSRVGYLWGVVPLDAVVLIFLVVRRRFRDGLFFGIAVIGSGVLNIVAKNHYARLRPDLWISLTPESTYSFPSGHAMGSSTLGMAMVLLCWPTRGRFPVIALSLGFVLLVGISRVYLGVHYPSDILAGWTAAIAWTLGMYLLVDRKARPPPSSAAPSRDTVGAGGPIAQPASVVVPRARFTHATELVRE